jgi:hypothetical protein
MKKYDIIFFQNFLYFNNYYLYSKNYITVQLLKKAMEQNGWGVNKIFFILFLYSFNLKIILFFIYFIFNF